YASARASYPTFLPFTESLWLQARWALKGFIDANRWDLVVRLVASDAEVRSNIFKSLLLNSISLLSVSVLDFLLHPLARGRPENWLHRNLGLFYQILWITPVVGVSLYLNGAWCTLVAKRVYTLRYGLSSYVAPPSVSTNTYIAFLHALATSAYRGAMIITSVALSYALGFIPLAGRPAEFVYFAWVDAFYCFEFVWIARGLSLSKRVRHLEEHWAYYLAFGIPVAAFCMWGSALANAAFFALLFPSYIIMATHARPAPDDPYNPSDAPSITHPSPYVPIRVPVFAPVIAIDDAVLR
ncbi:etoposide-induced protein 2.4-domain-containing protein, partial [Vararia minispora EC-137]